MVPMKVEFGSKTLKLVLDGNTTLEIEKKLDKSLFSILLTGQGGMRMPKLGEMLTIIHCANTTANIKVSDMPGLYDAYVKSGGTMMKLLEVIQELMEKAGFFESDEMEDGDLIGESKEEPEESLI